MFDFSIVTNWIHEMLLSVMPEGWAIFIECIAVGVCIVALSVSYTHLTLPTIA